MLYDLQSDRFFGVSALWHLYLCIMFGCIEIILFCDLWRLTDCSVCLLLLYLFLLCASV